MAKKPSLPSGTRDFSPLQMQRRNFIFDTLKSVFKKFGFLQIETPAMERLETLTGKYGEEGDRLIFRILNSGEKFNKNVVHPKAVKNAERIRLGRELTDDESKEIDDNYAQKLKDRITDKALRYDLTVPFARYVVQHQNEITFPFKRYQIQPVWRADRPQKGRYREFYQCDCDVIGTKSLVSEVEFVQIYDEGLSKLGLPQFEIRINNRKLLAGMVQYIDAEDKLTDFTVAIDKLDKIGKEKVGEELLQRGFSQKAVETLDFILELDGANMEKIEQLKARFEGVETAMKGLEELEYVVAQTEKLGLRKGTLVFDPALARGLDYYTGTIYEVKALNVNMGSIGGGGRYDNLTGIFGVDGISGVGISFGADRIYDVLEELDLFPQELTSGPTVLFVHFGDAERDFSLNWVTKLRNKGIFAEVYPDNAKMKKQMKYADSVGAKFVAVIGEEELQTGKITVKEMETGEQRKVKKTELINFFLDVKG